MAIPPDDHWNLENPMENDDNPMNFGYTISRRPKCHMKFARSNVRWIMSALMSQFDVRSYVNIFAQICLCQNASEFWLDFYTVTLRWRWHKVTWFPEMFIVGPSFVLPGLGISPRDPGFVTAGHHHFQRGHQCLRERLGSFNAASMDW